MVFSPIYQIKIICDEGLVEIRLISLQKANPTADSGQSSSLIMADR